MNSAEIQNKNTERQRRLEHKKWLICTVVLVLLALVAGYRYHAWMFSGAGALTPAGDGAACIAVHVKGAVEHPGVYCFTPEQRVLDAVNAAVPAANADLEGLNLAAYLVDGSQLVVPVISDGDEAASQANPTYLGGGNLYASTEDAFPGAKDGGSIAGM